MQETQETWMSNKGIRWVETVAHRRFEDVTGIVLSYALTDWCHDYCKTIDCGKEAYPWYSWRKITPAEHQAELEEAFRFAGWMEALVKVRPSHQNTDPATMDEPLKRFVHYGVLRVIRAGNSGRALNSPYNRYRPKWLFEHYPSPGRLERIVWKVRRKAEAILDDYGFPMRPSWTHLGMVLCKQHNPKRAARVLAAMTMTVNKSKKTSFDQVPKWRKSRKILVELAGCKLPVAIPEGRREAEPFEQDGVHVYRARREAATIWRPAIWVEGPEGGHGFYEKVGERLWLLKLKAAAAAAGHDPELVKAQDNTGGVISFRVSSPEYLRPPGYAGYIHNGALVPSEKEWYEGYRIDATCIIMTYVPRCGYGYLDRPRPVYVRPDTRPEELIEYLTRTFRV